MRARQQSRHRLSTQTDNTAAHPALAAFGGWGEAAWFSASVLTDPDVVSFELPKLAGTRRQAFGVIDRTLTKAPARKTEQEPARPPRRAAGKVALLLDGAGALRAVASCRTRLLFDTGAVLFFADIPTARLKPRAAAKLRRELVALGMRACVLRARADATTLMVWPSSETGITGFVTEAGPTHALHPDFDRDQAALARPQAKGRAAAASAPPDKRAQEREARLLREIATLQGQVNALTRAHSTAGAMEQLGLDDARLKSMLKLLHPDKHGGSEAATEAAKWLNGLRDVLRGRTDT